MKYREFKEFLTNEDLLTIDNYINSIYDFIKKHICNKNIISIKLNDLDNVFDDIFSGALIFENFEHDGAKDIKIYFKFLDSQNFSKNILEMNYLEKLYIINNWQTIKHFYLNFLETEKELKKKIAEILDNFSI